MKHYNIQNYIKYKKNFKETIKRKQRKKNNSVKRRKQLIKTTMTLIHT